MESIVNLRSNLKLSGTNPNESTPLSRAIFFIVIGVAFYLLDRFSLFYIDDYDYAFKFGTYERIQSLKDIFVSQCDHYMLRNGRFLVHCVVQLFCGIVGVEWFRIFNTLFFVAFCGLTTRLICGTKQASIMWYSLTAFVIWIFMPQIGRTILGNIACGVNYHWVGVANLFFLLLYEKLGKQQTSQSLLLNIGYGVLGVIIGSLQESFSIPIAGAFFIYYCFNYKQFKGSIAWLICGYWLGSIAVVLAPGNFVRVQKEVLGESIIITSIRRLFRVVGEYSLLIVVALLHFALWLKDKVQMKSFVSQNILIYGMLLIALAFTIIIAYTGLHQLFFICWLVVAIILKLIYGLCGNVSIGNKTQLVVLLLVIICVIPMYAYAYKYRAKDYIIREQLVNDIKRSQDGNVVASSWYGNEMMKSKFEKRYAPVINFEPKKYYTSLYYSGDVDHLKNYIPCPLDELEAMLREGCVISPNVWYLESHYCYVIKLPNTVSIDDVKIEATYPIVGVSGLKRQLMKEPLTIAYILTDKEIRDVVQYGDSQYAILWQSYNDSILNLRIID